MKFKGEFHALHYFFFENEVHPFSNPRFLSVIVNGEWFPIKPGIIDDVPGYGRGFIWRPPIVVGATAIIVAGDDRGNASGGGMVMMVGSGMPFTTNGNGVEQCPPPNRTGMT